jgi:hypothetical protein
MKLVWKHLKPKKRLFGAASPKLAENYAKFL